MPYYTEPIKTPYESRQHFCSLNIWIYSECSASKAVIIDFNHNL
jgi:hypothetical protein